MDNAQPGPGVPAVDEIVSYSATTGTDSWAGYLALQRRIGNWTPYAYVAQIRSSAASRRLYVAMNDNSCPARRR